MLSIMDILLHTRRAHSAEGRGRNQKEPDLVTFTKYRTSRSEPLLMSVGQSVVSDRWHVSRCKYRRCDPVEFMKVVEFEDIGVVIYRCMAKDNQHDGEPREIFLVQNNRERVLPRSSNVLSNAIAKCKTDCPRCKRIFERAERLLLTVPWVNKPGVAAICDHVYKAECMNCPSCSTTVDKFLAFINNEVCTRRDTSETQTLEFLNAKDTQMEEVKVAKEKEDKNKRQLRKRPAEFGDADERKVKKGKEKQDEKEKKEESKYSKSKKGKVKTDKLAEQTAIEKSMTKMGNRDEHAKNLTAEKRSVAQKAKSGSTLKSGNQADKSRKGLQKPSGQLRSGSLVKKDRKLSGSNVKRTENKATQTQYDREQLNLMRILIAEQRKQNLRQEKQEKAQQKEKGDAEKLAEAVEKRIMEDQRIARLQEEAMRLKLKPTAISETSVDSSSGNSQVINECNDAATDDGRFMVQAEKICIRKEVKTPPNSQPQAHTPCKARPPSTISETTVNHARNLKKDGARNKTLNVEHHGKVAKGVLRYSLSDRKYIETGWTVLPKELLVRQMNRYRMHRARPEFDWFEHNKHKRELLYSSGQILAKFEGGRCQLFYKNGKLALDYYNAEGGDDGKRLVVYSAGEQDVHGHPHARPPSVLAMFDYSGNGVVLDHAGNVRMKYNQSEGIILDRDVGPASHWKWHSLNDPPLVRNIIVDTYLEHKDPTIQIIGEKISEETLPQETNISADAQMLAIELENAKAHTNAITRLLKYAPYKIRMKALRINEQFSLKVLDQAAVYLNFCDGTTNFKINVGMVLDPTVIVSQEFIEFGEVWNVLDKVPADTDSVERLQDVIRQARVADRARVAHDRRLNPTLRRVSQDEKSFLSRPVLSDFRL